LDKIKALIEKYKDIIPYGVFGVLTTIVNIVVYKISADYMGLKTVTSTILAWIAAVLFAYFTNRKWVFKSYATTPKELLKEFCSFITCRLGTGVVDVVGMKILVDILMFNGTIMKALLNIVVIILNYLASKFIIFKKSDVKPS
jgi:putative flippase GtrA